MYIYNPVAYRRANHPQKLTQDVKCHGQDLPLSSSSSNWETLPSVPPPTEITPSQKQRLSNHWDRAIIEAHIRSGSHHKKTFSYTPHIFQHQSPRAAENKQQNNTNAAGELSGCCLWSHYNRAQSSCERTAKQSKLKTKNVSKQCASTSVPTNQKHGNPNNRDSQKH